MRDYRDVKSSALAQHLALISDQLSIKWVVFPLKSDSGIKAGS